MTTSEPEVTVSGGFIRGVKGVFFRAVDATHADVALAGSQRAGRYSAPGQPTLYLSASPSGVAAAMLAHGADETGARTVLRFHVTATGIFDLRDDAAMAAVRTAAGDPLAAWQHHVQRGDAPSSWRVRDWIEARGANGLIDPSRKAPGLWHLVLFRWNEPGAPAVVSVSP